ncbi:MAG: FkbM family methyltransferase [Bacteroidota bacterium]|nr:FkbM family methyltransferase [Bacteroidota bacterium]
MQAVFLPAIRWLARAVGLRRGVHRLVELTLREKTNWELARDRDGNFFLLNLKNYLDARLYLAGSYEEEEIRTFRYLVWKANCTVFIDVGANIGLYTVSIGKISTIATIHAFEPDLLNRYQLIANILLNDLSSKVIVYDIALSSEHAYLPLYRCSNPKEFDAHKVNTGTHSIHYNPQWHDDVVTVECKRADDILEMRNERLAIKIDVEGHEEQVLQGMKQLLTENVSVLLIESLPARYSSVEHLLAEYGYNCHYVFKDHNYIFSNIGKETID